MNIENTKVAHKPVPPKRVVDSVKRLFKKPFESQSFEWGVKGLSEYEVSLTVITSGEPPESPAVLEVEFYDKDSQILTPPDGYSSSRSFDAYRMLKCSPKGAPLRETVAIDTPANAAKVKLVLHAWNSHYIKIKGDVGFNIIREAAPVQALKKTKALVASATVEMAVNPSQLLTAYYSFEAKSEPARKFALLKFTFVDANGKHLYDCPRGLAKSKLGTYKYLDHAGLSGSNSSTGTLTFEAPANAQSCKIQLMPWSGQISSGSVKLGEAQQPKAPKLEKVAPADPRLVVTGQKVDVKPVVAVNISIQTRSRLKDKNAVLVVKYFDQDGVAIKALPPGFSMSNSVGVYQYVPVSEKVISNGSGYIMEYPVFIVSPENADTCYLEVLPWGSTKSLDVAEWEILDQSICEFVIDANLGELHSDHLKSLFLTCTNIGDTASSLVVAKQILAKQQTAQNGFRVRFLEGRMRELDTNWVPRIPNFKTSRKKLLEDGSVLHLFKTIYPMESSGGAVRNWSIARLQASSGRRVVAGVLQTATDDFSPSAILPLDHDGIRDMETDGFKITFNSYAGLNIRAVPADELLEFNAAHLAKIVADEKIHIVHAASGYRGYDSALQGLALAKHFNRPFVYEVRSFHEHTWGPLTPISLEAPLTQLRILQENRCMLEADSVITISKALREQLILRGVAAKKIFVVPNSINKNFAEPLDESAVARIRENLGIGDKTVVGYISNLSKREGISVLLEGFQKFHEKVPHSVCLLVGDGIVRDELEALAVKLGIEDHVIFTGFVDHGDIRSYYGTIDLFVTPRISDYASDFVTPMKPFEAMALKRPLLMSDRPVSSEIVGGTETRGLLFETGNPDSLCEKLIYMMEDADATTKRVNNAFRWLKKNRTWESQVPTYDAAYEYAIAEWTRKKVPKGSAARKAVTRRPINKRSPAKTTAKRTTSTTVKAAKKASTTKTPAAKKASAARTIASKGSATKRVVKAPTAKASARKTTVSKATTAKPTAEKSKAKASASKDGATASKTMSAAPKKTAKRASKTGSATIKTGASNGVTDVKDAKVAKATVKPKVAVRAKASMKPKASSKPKAKTKMTASSSTSGKATAKKKSTTRTRKKTSLADVVPKSKAGGASERAASKSAYGAGKTRLDAAPLEKSATSEIPAEVKAKD